MKASNPIAYQGECGCSSDGQTTVQCGKHGGVCNSSLTTTPVPDELLRELKAAAAARRAGYANRRHGGVVDGEAADALVRITDKLPDPPKPDPVEECAKAVWESHVTRLPGTGRPWLGLEQSTRDQIIANTREVIVEYRKQGCPEIPE